MIFKYEAKLVGIDSLYTDTTSFLNRGIKDSCKISICKHIIQNINVHLFISYYLSQMLQR
nr:MAG TPA: hypothetical protein [Caudoviricetes sp.]